MKMELAPFWKTMRSWDAPQNCFVHHWRETQHLQKARQEVDKDFAQKAESAEASERHVLT